MKLPTGWTALLALITATHLQAQQTLTNATDNIAAEELLVQHLRDTCPVVLSSRRPVLNASSSVQGSVNFLPLSFDGIQDTEQTFTIFGVLVLTWQLPSCAAWYKIPQFASVQQLIFRTSSWTEPLWYPRTWLKNSAETLFWTDDSNGQIFYLNAAFPHPPAPPTMIFYSAGRFKAECDLSKQIVWFPFDIQTCSLDFEAWADTPHVNMSMGGFLFQDFGTKMTPGFISPSDVWELTNFTYTTVVDIYFGQHLVSHRFNFTFARKSNYYILQIILPMSVILCLQLAAFVMPPSYPDRPALSATLVLASFVLFTSVSNTIPVTSIMIYVSVYSSGGLVLCASISVYFFFANAIADIDEPTRKKAKVKQNNIVTNPNRFGLAAAAATTTFTAAATTAFNNVSFEINHGWSRIFFCKNITARRIDAIAALVALLAIVGLHLGTIIPMVWHATPDNSTE